ncbi:MAG: DUF4342 domain-containing protein [Peptococcaceae bacterium]|nr:DUF4342 domain-containing protein [Peptococcaceae bacterium]
MEVTLEQVEKLRGRAKVSYEDAKLALDITSGDLLEAVIYLERQGKIERPVTGSYSTRSGSGEGETGMGPEAEATGAGAWDTRQRAEAAYGRPEGEKAAPFWRQVKNLWRGFCRLLQKANNSQFEVRHQGRKVISVPVTLLVLAVLFFFWVTLPTLVIALFFDCRYAFRGPELEREGLNTVLDKAADKAADIKRSVTAEENSRQ